MRHKLALVYHTVKYLKPAQVLGRFIHLLPRRIQAVTFTPALRLGRPLAAFLERKGLTEDYDHFVFLSEGHRLSEVGWDHQGIAKLWRYNLHYFEYLRNGNHPDTTLALQQRLVGEWIAGNPFGKGTAWEPYPTSHRIVNWIKWHWATGGLNQQAITSLWNQVRWLAGRPEYHLLGNHLFINAKALFFAAAFFQGDESDKIYQQALKILTKELDEQFLADGGHFELTPMYHALGMEDLLDLLNIGPLLPRDFPLAALEHKWQKGMAWLDTMRFPNDELPHFNDTANGIAATFTELAQYARSLKMDPVRQPAQQGWHHAQSGFVVMRNAAMHLLADIGPVGPDYLPGHAHADTLSFELAIGGQRVVVNSGTSEYGLSAERLRQRSTPAHSTITVDGANSSEVWSGFRVARRAYPVGCSVEGAAPGGVVRVTCAHNGYLRLPGRVLHRRSWQLTEKGLLVSDELEGTYRQAISRFYLHPDIQVIPGVEGLVLGTANGSLCRITAKVEGKAAVFAIRSTTYHPRFGQSIPNSCLELELTGEKQVEVYIEKI